MQAISPRPSILGFLLAASSVIIAASQCFGESAADSWLSEALVLPSGGRFGRTAFRIDPIEASVVRGDWKTPHVDDSVQWGTNGFRTWISATANAEGWFTNSALRGGYASFTYNAPAYQVLLLTAAGHNMVYLNGEPHAGDIYEYGYTTIPVRVRPGTNEFLFAAGRGRLRLKLSPPQQPVYIDNQDSTLPDLIAGRASEVWGAVRVINTTTNSIQHLQLTATTAGKHRIVTDLPTLPPLSTRKVGFRIQNPGHAATNTLRVELVITGTDLDRNRTSTRSSLSLRLLKAGDKHKETFISEIDGSVQYYAITPAHPESETSPVRALVLSTHGASVEASGQAAAYSHKSWAHLVAPTNRRPYGFDWEDWGRLDALEVLQTAQSRYHTDPRLTYLTGHSMGGHGTWQLGATFPDRFAAIAPSAGWISFFSYAGGRRDESTNAVRALFQRAANPSDTLLLASNYLQHGIYVLHGDADDNVPVSEARTMKKVLEGFHHEFLYHEQPGAGHWWGNVCVDWPPIFDLFSKRQIPHRTAVRHVQFITANPGISSRCHWLNLEAQERSLSPSRIDIEWDSERQAFKGQSENVVRLSLDTETLAPNKTVSVVLDGQSLTNLVISRSANRLWLERRKGLWTPIPKPSLSVKGPHRSGPFKEAFQHRMLFVYATHGTPQENAWAVAKSRFDSEAFLYRGNASVDVIPDTEFTLRSTRDRGVVLYGNASNHSAWDLLLKDSPIQPRRDGIQIGNRSIAGSKLACLFLRPRPDSDIASVAVVGGSGIEGLRLTDRLPYFLAGVAFPDCTVFDSETLTAGADGIRVAGFFGNDWSVEHGEFAWKPASQGLSLHSQTAAP